jgi:hypothetical protein
MTVAIVNQYVAVTVNFTGFNLGVGSALAFPDSERFCTVSMTITNPSQNANLTWNTVDAAITDSRGTITVTNEFYGSDTGPLPITLSSFTAVKVSDGKQVQLHWTTISEVQNYGFEVQKSEGNTNNYTTIPNSFIAGHGTTTVTHSYTYTDVNASGQGYYRLKQTDLSGEVHYTDGVSPNGVTAVTEKPLPTKFELQQNYPNPFNPTTTINYALPKQTHVKLEVYNVIGELVTTLVDENQAAGYYSRQFDASRMASGLYFYRFTSPEMTFLKKMVLLK